jgi:hypothetical protein
VVSTIFSKSKFVTTRSGRYRPVPAIREYIDLPVAADLAKLLFFARHQNTMLDGRGSNFGLRNFICRFAGFARILFLLQKAFFIMWFAEVLSVPSQAVQAGKRLSRKRICDKLACGKQVIVL